ncbi:MAG: sensor histidine kinase [Bacteroidota bacterium]
MKLLKVPETNLPDFYERAKFALAWRIAVMFTLVVFFLTLTTLLTGDRFFPYYVAVLLFSVFSVIYLYWSRSYKRVAQIMLCGATAVIISAVLMVRDAIHVIEPLWMTVVILAAFFTLNRQWGTFFLVINTGLYATYFLFFMDETRVERFEASAQHVVIMSVEFGFAMFLIGYIMYQFNIVNNYARVHSDQAFTQLKEEKNIVERQNKEKTVLLQEIHHRVKNNLQVIISLLRIQSSELKSDEARQSFSDAISRILTMSLIHQKMYERESLANIDVQDYLNTLIDDLIRTNAHQSDISYEVRASLENVGAKSIVPLGLIINELVSNSLKHAFAGRGTISIELKASSEGRATMIYSDDGNWKPPSSASFGLQLIDVFTEQLEGSVERNTSDSGTFYTFEALNIRE